MKYKNQIIFIIFSSLIMVFCSSAVFPETSPNLPPYNLPTFNQCDFNTLAKRERLSIFWEDTKKNGLIEPNEIHGLNTSDYVKNGSFTKEFEKAYRKLVELKRREMIKKELDEGRPTIVLWDLQDEKLFSKNDKKFIKQVIEASRIIEEIYQMQKGSFECRKQIAKDDDSFKLYKRNQGVWGETPDMEKSAFCNAVPSFPERKSWNYPQDLKNDSQMCEMLGKQPNAKDHFNPFTVVRRKGSGFISLPYSHRNTYGPKMKKVASKLREASKYIDPKYEKPLVDYLTAAAKAFENNDWETADEAWAKMNPDNSKWYLRIAPDEVDVDICGEKAGFEVVFAIIDNDSKSLEQKLAPIKDEMEGRIANLLVDTPYKKRNIEFKIPDFIRILLNAGDSRTALGAYTGQALPNYGKVSTEGRGRSVVRTNLEEDDHNISLKRAELLFSPQTIKNYDPDPKIHLFNVVIHEVTHLLGPQSEINGNDLKKILGGKLEYTLDEIKAQTGVLWFLTYLFEKGLLPDKESLTKAYTACIFHDFDYIGGTRYSSAYKKLAAVQLGTFLKEGVITKVPYEDLKTGRKDWRFEIDYLKIPGTAEKLIKLTSELKAFADRTKAEEFIRSYPSEALAELIDEIQKRYRTFKEPSFSYEFKFGPKDIVYFP